DISSGLVAEIQLCSSLRYGYLGCGSELSEHISMYKSTLPFSLTSLLAIGIFPFLINWSCGYPEPAPDPDNDQIQQADQLSNSPCAQFQIPEYQAFRTVNPPIIDGQLDETEWQLAP